MSNNAIESLKTELSLKNEMLREAKAKLRQVESDIKDTEREKRNAENDSTLGLVQMSNSSLRPIGTYNFLSGSGKAESFRNRLKDLAQEERRLQSDIRSLESDVSSLERKIEYESRPEAVLVVGEDFIGVEGDEKNHNLIYSLAWDMAMFVKEYERLMASDEVVKHPELEQTIAEKKAELEALVATLDLPEDTEENRKKLFGYKRASKNSFDYIGVAGKLLVDKDFVASSLSDKQFIKKTYEDRVAENRKKYEQFEPNLTGKIFKGLGKKQKAEWDKQVSDKEASLQAEVKKLDAEIGHLQNVQATFITPSKPARKLLQQISELVERSCRYQKVISEADGCRKKIESHTIFANKTENEIMNSLLSGVRYYLDKNKLKISKESIFEAICSNPQFADLAQEIMNATGYNPASKAKAAEQVGPSNG